MCAKRVCVKNFSKLLSVIFLMTGVSVATAAVDDDALAQMLMRKGVLAPHEVRSLQRDAAAQRKAFPAQKNISPQGHSGLPSWVSKMKWGGDMRVRYENQQQDVEPTAVTDRNRMRIRARYGFKAEINDQVEMGIRIASGENSPTSTNNTLEDAFGRGDLKLDRAYIKYQPNDNATLMFGKFANPFFSTDLVFDKDLSFDGFGQSLAFQSEYADYYIIMGQSPLDHESNDNNTPWLYGFQAGVVFDPYQDVEMELAIADYAYTNLFNYTSLGVKFGDTSRFGATLTDRFTYSNSYNLFNITSKIKFAMSEVPMMVVGDYVKNLEATSGSTGENNTGYQVGLHIGDANKPKTLEAFAYYKKLEADAVVDVFTDSDFGGGGTNHKGFKTGLKYQMLENTQLGLTYIDANLIEDEGTVLKEDSRTVQVDMSVRF